MTLHIYCNPPRDPARPELGAVSPLDIMGTNVWVTDVPEDFTDDDVRYNVEKWAADGDKCAKRALELLPGYWLAYRSALDWPRTRVYVDD